jgi:cysteine-S-conjugate beta-lyase
MHYNFDQTPKRRLSGVLNKWTWFPKDILPMWVADMDFSAPPPILEALQKYAEHGDLGYRLPSRKLQETIAARLNKLYKWEISPEMIIAVPGVNSGYNIAARTFWTSEKGYLIQTPVYNEFHETHRKTGMPQVEAPLVKKVKGHLIDYEIDFDSFAQLAPKASLFLLCNPHNPVGSVYSPAELTRLAEICLRDDMLIISDEIHSELLLDDSRFRPIASLDPEIEARTITLISASKAFNVPGLFCAFAIIPNAQLRKLYAETVLKMGVHVSSAGLVAAQSAYSGRCDGWLRELRNYLTENRDFVIDYVRLRWPEVRITMPQATYLAWLDFTQLEFEKSPYDFFFEKAKVALSDGAIFGENGRGHIRLNFGTSRKILKQGLDRMQKALQSL